MSVGEIVSASVATLEAIYLLSIQFEILSHIKWSWPILQYYYDFTIFFVHFLLSFDIVNFFPPNVQMLSSISRFPSKVIKMKLVLDMAKVIASFSLPKIHIAIIVLCLNFHHLPGNDAHLYACSVSDFDRTYDYMASLPHRLVFMLTNMCSNAVWMVITCRSTRICA